MDAEARHRNWVGEAVDGRFPLLQWLGDSRRSTVFLTSLPTEPERRAVIKLFPAEGGDAEASIAAWREAARLSHPHLMTIYHAGRCQLGGELRLFLVTEYAEEILSQILPERALTPAEAREMLAPVLEAISYLHNKGYVHGWLKPAKIMVVDDRLKLFWDPVAAKQEPALPLSIYDAPETAGAPRTPASDVWSLGVTLVEALTQTPPVWQRSASADPLVPESIPQPFAAIARESLRSSAAERCTIREIKARLLAARFSAEPKESSGAAQAARLRWFALAGAALLIAFCAYFLFRSHPAESTPTETTESTASADQPAQPPPAATQPATETQPRPQPQQPSQPAPKPSPLPARVAVSEAGGGVAVERPLPDVPEKARATIHGKVLITVRVTVDAGGGVSNAELETPSSSKYFASLAVQAARHWRFQPVSAGSPSEARQWLVRFQFSATGTEAAPVEATR